MRGLPHLASSLHYGNLVNRACPLSRGLLAWWVVLPQGGKGNTFFDIASRYHGILTSGPTWGGPQGCPGAFGSVSFDGTDDRIPSSNIVVGATWTLLAWVNLTNTAVARTVIAQIDSGAANATFYWRYGATSGYTVGGTSYREITLTSPTLGEWTRCALRYDGANLTGWKNGSQIDTAAKVGTPDNPGTTTCTIGRLGDFSGNYWLGSLDSIKVYARALTDSEIAIDNQDSRLGYPQTLNRVRPYTVVDVGGGGATAFPWHYYQQMAA